MSEQKQLTQEELDFITKTKNESSNLVMELGQIKIERLTIAQRVNELDAQEKNLETQFASIIAREKDFTKKLFEKYGDAIVDIENGTIKPNN